MNKVIMFIVVVLAFLAGLYGGYWYEKNKLVSMMAMKDTDYQKQITDLKMMQVQVKDVTAENDVYAMKSDAKGQFLTDTKGMTLYMFDKDSKGVSNCIGNCAVAWPPYLVKDKTVTKFPQYITTINRADDVLQYAYKDMPLYYYKSDVKPGDVLGDGVGGTWHLVK